MHSTDDLHLVTPTKLHKRQNSCYKMTSKQQKKTFSEVEVILTHVYANIIRAHTLFNSITTPWKGYNLEKKKNFFRCALSKVKRKWIEMKRREIYSVPRWSWKSSTSSRENANTFNQSKFLAHQCALNSAMLEKQVGRKSTWDAAH